jgi:dihydroxyacetone kinase-like protein
MQALDSDGVRHIARHLRRLMDEQREYLLELDRAIGDGDLGLTMTRAFTAAEEAADAEQGTPGRVFIRMGAAMAKAAPSTMGTLMATGFMRGGKAVGEAAVLETADLARFFGAFVDGILERGKTKLGNKTVADALAPAADALREAAGRGDQPSAALQAAAIAADAGRVAAKQMMSQHGKAAVFREQTIGVEDPGAVVGAMVVRGFAEAVASPA